MKNVIAFAILIFGSGSCWAASQMDERERAFCEQLLTFPEMNANRKKFESWVYSRPFVFRSTEGEPTEMAWKLLGVPPKYRVESEFFSLIFHAKPLEPNGLTIEAVSLQDGVLTPAFSVSIPNAIQSRRGLVPLPERDLSDDEISAFLAKGNVRIDGRDMGFVFGPTPAGVRKFVRFYEGDSLLTMTIGLDVPCEHLAEFDPEMVGWTLGLHSDGVVYCPVNLISAVTGFKTPWQELMENFEQE